MSRLQFVFKIQQGTFLTLGGELTWQWKPSLQTGGLIISECITNIPELTQSLPNPDRGSASQFSRRGAKLQDALLHLEWI